VWFTQVNNTLVKLLVLFDNAFKYLASQYIILWHTFQIVLGFNKIWAYCHDNKCDHIGTDVMVTTQKFWIFWTVRSPLSSFNHLHICHMSRVKDYRCHCRSIGLELRPHNHQLVYNYLLFVRDFISYYFKHIWFVSKYKIKIRLESKW
jgi:hypothetical protein